MVCPYPGIRGSTGRKAEQRPPAYACAEKEVLLFN
jgi:hypothetical protein